MWSKKCGLCLTVASVPCLKLNYEYLTVNNKICEYVFQDVEEKQTSPLRQVYGEMLWKGVYVLGYV